MRAHVLTLGTAIVLASIAALCSKSNHTITSNSDSSVITVAPTPTQWHPQAKDSVITTTSTYPLANHIDTSQQSKERGYPVSDNNYDSKGIDDGKHTATVDYYNPATGYTATYTLYVEVQDCKVIQIDFPKGGYLDEDHITFADLNEDGKAKVDGEDGKTYDVQINDN